VNGTNRRITRRLAAIVALLLTAGVLAATAGRVATASAATPSTLDLQVLLIGGGTTDPTTLAWESALNEEGVPFTLVQASGTAPDETVTLPTLSSGSTGYYNGVVIADDPADFASGQLSALDSYEATFGVRQLDGYTYPTSVLGLTDATAGALDGTTGTLTTAGGDAFGELSGTVTFDTGTYGYSATVNSGAPFTPFLTNSSGDVLAGVYQHPSTDPQASVSEMELSFDYNSSDLQWSLLSPGLIDWVTQSTHLGLDRKYVAMDIDDTFTPDNAWSTAVHDNDYSDADSLRMDPTDVITAADWSNPTQESTPDARPSGEPTTPFRLDQLFNYGGTVEYQDGDLDLAGEPSACETGNTADDGTCGPDPLLAQFQATDPATGQSYADDFGWLSHTYDTPYLDVGCATQDYIEAELNENTSDILAAPGSTPGTGGLGITSSTDVNNALGYYNPQVFVPGNHSGFADLAPGTPATVDPPDLDSADANASGGTLSAGTYEYAVTDQFNGSDSTSTDQSQAYVTDGEQGDLSPVTVSGSTGSVDLVWEAICHAANYIIYRAPVSSGVVGSWTEIGTYATPDSATLPDNSSGDSTPASTTTVCQGPSPNPTSCAGQQELTFTDTGSDTSTPPTGVTYVDTPMPAGWTPPVVENANETPWEQNPYFTPALEAAGITTVGADASKPYPDPADDQFGIGATYTGPEYAAGQAFTDGTSEVAPRHPINIFYNVATNAQELDEYNTLYSSAAPDSQCHDTSTTTCSSTLFTFPQVIDQVVSGMFENMMANNPEVSYVHQTNLMGTPPYSSILPPSDYVPASTAQTGTDGDGTLYEVLNPLIAEYDSYFNSSTPYIQPTLGGIGDTLAEQTAWSNVLAATTPSVTASETNGVVTIDNTGTGSVNVPVTVPPGTTVSGSATLQSYGGELSNWVTMAGSTTQTLTENIAPAITSASSASSIVGSAFSFTVTTTGYPAPALTESGTLPSGLTFTDNGNGTATIAGTTASGSGGSYPITITATSSAGTTTQSFTLTNSEAPTITSASTATFSTGVAGTYTVTTTGYPAPSLTESGTLPSGLTFTDNGNGTGTIAGTPASGTAGSYPVTISATNSSGSTATLALTITVNASAAPAFTNSATADFTVNQDGAVAITTTGSPTPAITETGTLPAGLTFTDNGNGTGLLSGTPTSTGTTIVTFTASNGISPDATQSYTIVVGQVPAFTSADTATATSGTPFTFTVTTSGYPAPDFGWGNVPPGLTFTDNGDGTATLSGTPTTTGTYAMDLSATNSYGTADQTLTVTVQEASAATIAPAITSTGSATFSAGSAGTFTVTTSGAPAAALTVTSSPALPSGLTFTDNGNGTGTLSGTAAAGSQGTYKITITASNSAGTSAQSFVLTINSGLAITSASSAAATAGKAFSFTVATSGSPAPSLSRAGTLPSGVTFTNNGNGTATLAGTVAATAHGVYDLTFTAKNSAATVSQTFTLTISQTAAFSSPASVTETAGTGFTFTVAASGYPVPALSAANLPSGVTFADNGNGTGTLSGTSSVAAGTYSLSLGAANAGGTVNQTMTLTVKAATGTRPVPAFTSAATDTVTAGKAFTFKVTTVGSPTTTYTTNVTHSGTLPAGVYFSNNGNGTATLTGTPTAASGGTYAITITAKDPAGSATQSFALTVRAAPAISSATTATATVGSPLNFTVKTTGSPTPVMSTSGSLPSGVTFTDNGDGTATLSGTPGTGQGGVYKLTLSAKNSLGTATQTFTLTVDQPPSITSATAATATAGSAFTFTFTSAGYQVATVTHTSSVAGLTYTRKTNGTATLTGTPKTDGIYVLTITARNSVGSVTQTFTLTVS
jgi:Putative Ig domain